MIGGSLRRRFTGSSRRAKRRAPPTFPAFAGLAGKHGSPPWPSKVPDHGSKIDVVSRRIHWSGILMPFDAFFCQQCAWRRTPRDIPAPAADCAFSSSQQTHCRQNATNACRRYRDEYAVNANWMKLQKFQQANRRRALRRIHGGLRRAVVSAYCTQQSSKNANRSRAPKMTEPKAGT